MGSLDGVMPQSENFPNIPCPDAHLCRQTSDVICDVQPAPDAGAKETGSLHHHWWDLEVESYSEKSLRQFLIELNFRLLYDLAVALLGGLSQRTEKRMFT